MLVSVIAADDVAVKRFFHLTSSRCVLLWLVVLAHTLCTKIVLKIQVTI